MGPDVGRLASLSKAGNYRRSRSAPTVQTTELIECRRRAVAKWRQRAEACVLSPAPATSLAHFLDDDWQADLEELSFKIHNLVPFGDNHGPAQARCNPVPKGLGRLRLAMHDEGSARRTLEPRQPSHDLGRVGMCRKAVNPLDRSPDVDHLTVNLDRLLAIDQPAAPRPRRLVTNKHHRRSRVGQPLRQMMEHPSPRGHS